jgi:hypothetical protein
LLTESVCNNADWKGGPIVHNKGGLKGDEKKLAEEICRYCGADFEYLLENQEAVGTSVEDMKPTNKTQESVAGVRKLTFIINADMLDGEEDGML